MEEKITFESGPCRLEGYWQAGAKSNGVVITHPHPLYGGTMNNPVVETVQSAYQQNGYATLRFNFRGVGGSQGNFDNGLGDQDDVRAAINLVYPNDAATGFADGDLRGWVWVETIADEVPDEGWGGRGTGRRPGQGQGPGAAGDPDTPDTPDTPDD